MAGRFAYWAGMDSISGHDVMHPFPKLSWRKRWTRKVGQSYK